jgi:hypothetical protein
MREAAAVRSGVVLGLEDVAFTLLVAALTFGPALLVLLIHPD